MLQRLFSIALVSASLLGCGVQAMRSRSGSLRLSVAFPSGFSTRLLPANTHRVQVLIFSSGQGPEQAMRPPALMPGRERMNLPGVPIGSQIVIAAALDCEGRILSAARTTVEVKPDPAVTPVTLELDANFGNRLESRDLQALAQGPAVDCPRPIPTPTGGAVTPGPNLSSPGSPNPDTSPNPQTTADPAAQPTTEPSPLLTPNPALQLELDVREGPDRTILLKTLLKGEASVAKIEYFVNDAPIGGSATPPYAATWETNPRGPGSYRIKAIAYDTDGKELAQSATSTVLLLLRDQISVTGGSGGSGGSIVIQPPAPTPTPAGIDVGTPGGASFDASVTLNDGSPTLGPITVDSP